MGAGRVSAQTRSQSSQVKENGYTITLESRPCGDSVVLRWMVGDPVVWMLANRDGWHITRTGGKNRTSKVEYLVKPWEISRISSVFGFSDMQAGALAQAIYGESRIPQSMAENPSAMVEYVCRLREEQLSRQTIVSMLACRSARYADAAGLRFVDHNVEDGATYEYIISFAGKNDIFTCSEASEIVKNSKSACKTAQAVKEVSVKQIDGSRIVVYWPTSNLKGYYLERALVSNVGKLSADKQTQTKKSHSKSSAKSAPVGDTPKNHMQFVPLNTVPIMKTDKVSTSDYPVVQLARDNVLFIDSLPPSQVAVYRVRGYDLFGDLSEWRHGDAFTMLEQHPLVPPQLVKVSPFDTGGCSLEWRAPSNVTYAAFVVAFATRTDGEWTNVSGKIDAGSSSFADSSAAKRGVGYYRLYAYDSLGRLAYSNILPSLMADTVALVAPQVLRGNAELVRNDGYPDSKTSAVVSLKWNEPKKRPDDLLGFRVFFSDRADRTFVEVSPSVIPNYAFSDTINVSGITAEAYYYVVAVDSRYNQSKPSDTVHVALPDVVSPEPCEWKSTKPGEAKTVIYWYRSKSDDVVKYNIYCQNNGSANWQWVSSIDSSTIGKMPYVIYSVPTSAQVFPVQYCIEAVDASGNSSARSGMVSLPANAKAVADITLKAKYNRKAASVTLDWQYAAKSDAKFVGVIYRSDDGAAPVAVGAFKPAQTSFTDSRLPKAKTVSYYIVLKSSQSAATKPSTPVQVSLK